MSETNEREYRGTLIRIGASMLMLVALLNLLVPLQSFLMQLCAPRLDDVGYCVVDQLTYGLVYVMSFVIPSAFFYAVSRHRPTQPLLTRVRLDRQFPLMVMATVALILGAAIANYYIVELFNFSRFTEAFYVDEPIKTNYQLVLAILTTAVIPGFVEELLFRGVVLGNLLPYGKAPAVLISAVLFGLMHQNPAQMFYATMAGIALGLVFVRTRSIWGGVLIHFLNNLFSVVEQLLGDRLAEATASRICTFMEGIVFALGLVSAIILICTNKKRVRDFSESGFGTVMEPDENYIERPMAKGRLVRRFFNPTIVIFMVLSCAIMLYYILIALSL